MLGIAVGRRTRHLVGLLIVVGGVLGAHGAAEAAPAPPDSDSVADEPADSGIVPGTPCAPAVRACVDLTRQRAWLIRDGQIERGPVPITSGGPGEETPTGDFKVQWKDKNHISDNAAATPMPYSVFFAEGGVALHGGSLRRESAGCVHLDEQDAMAFYDDLALNDAVQVLGSTPPFDPREGDQPNSQRGDRADRQRPSGQRPPTPGPASERGRVGRPGPLFNDARPSDARPSEGRRSDDVPDGAPDTP